MCAYVCVCVCMYVCVCVCVCVQLRELGIDLPPSAISVLGDGGENVRLGGEVRPRACACVCVCVCVCFHLCYVL